MTDFNVIPKGFTEIDKINQLKQGRNYLIRVRVFGPRNTDYIAKFTGKPRSFTYLYKRIYGINNWEKIDYNELNNNGINNRLDHFFENYSIDKSAITIYELGPTGQHISEKVSPDEATEIEKLVDTKLLNKIPEDPAELVKAFASLKSQHTGGKMKYNKSRKSKKSKKYKKSRKYNKSKKYNKSRK